MSNEDRPQDFIGDARQMTEETARRLADAFERAGALAPARHLRSSQIASGFLGAIGLALFLVGVENAASDLPVVSNAYGSMAIGIVLLSFTGALLARLRAV